MSPDKTGSDATDQQRMLAELSQFRDPATAKRQLEEILKQAETHGDNSHPLLEWLDVNPVSGPTLIFDTDRIRWRMRWLSDTCNPLSITPLVAVKSCPAPEYLKLGRQFLSGFDISNANEYSRLPDDLRGQLVSVTGPDLTTNLSRFTERGNDTVVTIDSIFQLNHYLNERPEIPYVLRIQGSDLLREATPPDPAYFASTRFGFTAAEAMRLMDQPLVRANPPAGFHVHHGSERNQASTYNKILQGLSRLAKTLPAGARYVNLGGGWHAMSRSEMAGVLNAARQVFPQPCSILVEPGRWYAEGAGFAVGTIVNQTQAGGTVKYSLNLSGRCHLHWSGVNLLHTVEPGCRQACDTQFFGSSCYEGDTIGRFLLPYKNDVLRESGLAPGAQVVFTGVSTYSAAWNTSFNGIPKADVIWWEPRNPGPAAAP